jgi:hypothetical protein
MTWKRTPVASPRAIARNCRSPDWPVAELTPLLPLVRGSQLAFGRKKENQPAEQKGHTTDYHRNANRIHFESSKEYRSGSFEDRKGRIRNCRPFSSGGLFRARWR